MFERFTDGARQAVAGGVQEASRLRHEHFGTEHLLLGVLGLPDDPAVRLLHGAGLELVSARGTVARLLGAPHPGVDQAALASIGVDMEAVREAVEASFGAGALDGAVAQPKRRRRGAARWTDPAKRALSLALQQAVAERTDRIEARHLVLGILAEGGGVAVRVLRDHGIDQGELEVALRAARA